MLPLTVRTAPNQISISGPITGCPAADIARASAGVRCVILLFFYTNHVLHSGGGAFIVSFNGLGIISVVTVCLWPISLILAIIGLCLSIAGKSRSSRTNTGGGMAITGIVLSCVALAMIALLLFAGMAFLRSIPTRYRYR